MIRRPPRSTLFPYTTLFRSQATRFVTLAATEKGAPVVDATVSVNDKEIGKTDAGGELVYEYKTLPKTGVTLPVRQSGYAAWQKTGALQPGERLAVALSRRSSVTVTALTEQYGHTSAVAGVAVSIDGKEVGKTDDRGVYAYAYDGTPGKRVELALSFPGYIPEQWKTAVTLAGPITIQRYFYPTTPKQIRVGVYRFGGNTLGVDLKEIVAH